MPPPLESPITGGLAGTFGWPFRVAVFHPASPPPIAVESDVGFWKIYTETPNV